MFALVLLAVAGLLAGYVNAVAGAGSLLTLPALIFTGLDAGAANATNRVAVLFQSAAALLAFRRSGAQGAPVALWLCLPASLGAAAGAFVATLLSNAQIKLAIALAMVAMLGLSLVPPRRRGGAAPTPLPARPPLAMTLAFLAVGFYGGFLQAGVGILIVLVLGLGFRASLVVANVVKVAVVLALTVVAIAVFAARRETLDPLRGGVLAMSTSLGGYLGARATVRRGERFVRLAIVAAVLASVARLAWDVLVLGR